MPPTRIPRTGPGGINVGSKFVVKNTKDENLDEVQREVASAFTQLEDARRGVLSAIVLVVGSSRALPESLLVRYVGQGGTTDPLLLPAANLRALARGMALVVMNESAATLTVKASGVETVDGAGSVTLTTGTAKVFTSNGQTKWFTIGGASGGGGVTSVVAGLGLTGGGVGPAVTLDVGANADGSMIVNANDIQVGVLATNAQHGNRGGGALHAQVTGATDGFMIALDKTKLDGIVTGIRGGGRMTHTEVGVLERWYYAGANNCAPLGTAITVLGVLRAFPFQAPPSGGTVDRIAFNVTTGVAGNHSIGIYDNTADNDLYPNALLATSGTVSSAASGVKSTTVSVVLQPGRIYWLTHVCSTTAATLRSYNDLSGMADWLGIDNTLGTGPGFGMSRTFAFAALPNPWGAGGAAITAIGTVAPALAYRLVS